MSNDDCIVASWYGEALCDFAFEYCTSIGSGMGVCGAAVAADRTMLVPDVHAFPGHIACDSASNSEIVVPIHVNGEIWGVLDIDSPILNRFTPDDQLGLEALARIIETFL